MKLRLFINIFGRSFDIQMLEKFLGKINHKTLSIVIPCYNEENTISECLENVLKIADENLSLEIIIVDDCSSDKSPEIINQYAQKYSEIKSVKLEKNSGKGAALRTGFMEATGDYVAVQDADLEYDPQDLKKLLEPLISGKADVVLGSRFSSSGVHRVLYFWHYMGNKFLTFLSNMFTDLNLTDMETCYKVFKREIIQDIELKENRFGFEPEIVAKIAQRRLKIYEMGISYFGRTYAEGKKIGVKDGFRALYCILKYNAHKAPLPIQFLIYLFIGGTAAIVNLLLFLVLFNSGSSILTSTLTAFYVAAFTNYFLSINILFRHKAKWNTFSEVLIYLILISIIGFADYSITNYFINSSSPHIAKILATTGCFILNFLARKFIVFKESKIKDW